MFMMHQNPRAHGVRIMLRILALVVCIVAVAPYADAASDDNGSRYSGPYLVGRLLVAAENMPDPNFTQTVILILEHDQNGAFGVVLNREIGAGPLSDLIVGFGLKPEVVDEAAMSREVGLRLGGPVDQESAMVIHSTDYQDRKSHDVGGGLAWTLESTVLAAAAAGQGPEKLLVFIGYAGWSGGQLEKEFSREDWLDADAGASLVFDTPTDALYDAVRAAAGLSL